MRHWDRYVSFRLEIARLRRLQERTWRYYLKSKRYLSANYANLRVKVVLIMFYFNACSYSTAAETAFELRKNVPQLGDVLPQEAPDNQAVCFAFHVTSKGELLQSRITQHQLQFHSIRMQPRAFPVPREIWEDILRFQRLMVMHCN